MIFLLQGNWKEAQEKVVTLEETTTCQRHFPAFLKSLYTQEIVLDEENVIPILMLADKYIVSCLIKECTNYMIDNLNFTNTIHWYKFALDYNLQRLRTQVTNYIKLNFSALKSKMLHLKKDQILEILSCDTLIVDSEGEVLRFVLDWMEAYDPEAQWEDCVTDEVAEVFRCVRFRNVLPHETLEVENHKGLKAIREQFLSARIQDSFRFHSGAYCNGFIKGDLEVGKEFLKSRVYTTRSGKGAVGFSSTRVGKVTRGTDEYVHVGSLSCPSTFSMALRNFTVNWSVKVSSRLEQDKKSCYVTIHTNSRLGQGDFAVLFVSKIVGVDKTLGELSWDTPPIALGYHKYITIKKGNTEPVSHAFYPYERLPICNLNCPMVFDISVYPLL